MIDEQSKCDIVRKNPIDGEVDYISKVDSPSEHRTTGVRSWCMTCNEWCYPNTPCGEIQCCKRASIQQVKEAALEAWRTQQLLEPLKPLTPEQIVDLVLAEAMR